jgi:hypothetical protein
VNFVLVSSSRRPEMASHFNGLSPVGLPDHQHRLQQVIDFWNGLSSRADAGETTWGVLEDIQTQVSDCLSRDPIDLEEAQSLTAYAALLIFGRTLF